MEIADKTYHKFECSSYTKNANASMEQFLTKVRLIFGCMCILGVKVRNLMIEFKTGGTWRRVGQQILIMKIYDFFIRPSLKRRWNIFVYIIAN